MNVVDLHGQLAHLEDDLEFLSDLCRFSENILSEKQVKKKWKFDDATWESLGSNDSLIEKIEAEKVRRIRDGASKREKAQLLVVAAPDVVSKIMNDDSANARHRIDSAKVLNDFAAHPAGQNAPTGDRFIISIVLSADGVPHTEHFNKSIKPDADDIDPDNIGGAPMIAAITAKKSQGGGSGEPI